MTISGWIGVDFDGTLAFYEGWKGEDVLGEPVPEMVRKVKAKLAEGVTVKIFTARVAVSDGFSEESQASADQKFADRQRELIQAWCVKHLGQKLDVTASKDFALIEIWDDRARRVKMNIGEFAEEVP